MWWTFTVGPTLKPHYHPFVFCHKQPSLLIMSFHSLQLWHNLFTYQNKRIQQLNKHTHTDAHLIKACLTAPSQCTMELCWHGPAWGMGRSEVYDCADVNDIIQILNQAACFQPCRSSPLAASLENLTWIPAAVQTNCCRHGAEWTAQTENDRSNLFWPSTRGRLSVCVCVCPSTRLFIHYFKCEGVHLTILWKTAGNEI